jgi:hypothetical protein
MKKDHINKLFLHVLKGGIITDKRLFIEVCLHSYEDYIMWRGYGSSAIKIDKEDFTWLFNVIFEDYTFNDLLLLDHEEYYTLLNLKNKGAL